MTDFEKMTTKIFKAINEITPETKGENMVKLATLVYLYHSFQSEDVFNDNVEALNRNTKEKRKKL